MGWLRHACQPSDKVLVLGFPNLEKHMLNKNSLKRF